MENPRGGGTVIHPDLDSDLSSSATISHTVPEPTTLKSLRDLALATEDSQRRRLPTAVTIKERVVVLNVHSNRKSVSHGFLAGIFGILDKFGVVVDLISMSEVHVSMAIGDALPRKNLDRLVKELQHSGTVGLYLLTHPNLRKVTYAAKPGICASRHGHPLVGREADAQHGRYRREDVHYACTGQCQH